MQVGESTGFSGLPITEDADVAIVRKAGANPADAPDSGALSSQVIQNIVGSDAALGARAHRVRTKPNPLAFVSQRLGGLVENLLGSDGDVAANANVLENRAFEVLEVLTPNEVGQAEEAFGAWFEDVEARANGGEKLDAMEHLTMLHLVKRGLFEQHETLAPFVERMKAALVASNLRLTGKNKPIETILEKRMPRRFLMKQSNDAQKIHAAIYASHDEGLLSTLGDFAKSYMPTAKDPIVGLGILALLFTGAGAHVVAGAVHGYLLATLIEHTIHQQIGHATPQSVERLDKILSKMGPIGDSIRQQINAMAFSHSTIHHGTYAGSYVDRFAPRDHELPEDEKAEFRERKKKQIDKLVDGRPQPEIDQIRGSDYGRKLAEALKSALYTAPVTAIATLVTGAIANTLGADVGVLFGVASVLTSLIFIPASNYLHPYLHMPREEAMSKAGPVMRAFLQSDYVAHVAQSHYLHHRDARVNQNLIAGADYALGYEATHVDAIVALRKLKTFY